MNLFVRDEDREKKENMHDKLPLEDIMQMWYEREHNVDKEIPTGEHPTGNVSPWKVPSDLFEHGTKGFEWLIAATSAYRWLIACLRNNVLLSNTNDGMISQIHQEIFDHILRSIRVGRRTPITLTKTIFELDWSF